jgi:hypothetical protein
MTSSFLVVGENDLLFSRFEAADYLHTFYPADWRDPTGYH